mmetsp:Transcript_6905/g.9551  ORF Transcript_6905/g.9551 Transcript_6905/m.9551 type:complete len:364 (+) Transcript_6905:1917-3008(+)
MNFFNSGSDLVFDLLNSLLLLPGVQIGVRYDSISELVRLDLNLVLHSALSMSLLGLLLDDLVDALHGFILLLLVFLFAQLLSLLGGGLNIVDGVLAPLLHVDLFAELKLALIAAKDILKDLIREVLVEQLVHVLFAELAIAESHGSSFNDGAHLFGQLRLHRPENLQVHFLLLNLVLLHCRLLIQLRLFLHVRLHLLHALAKLLNDSLELVLRLLLAVTTALLKLALDLQDGVLELGVISGRLFRLLRLLRLLLLGLFLLGFLAQAGNSFAVYDVVENASHVASLVILPRKNFLHFVEHLVLFSAHFLLVILVYRLGCFLLQLVLVGHAHGCSKLLGLRLGEDDGQVLGSVTLGGLLEERRGQ